MKTIPAKIPHEIISTKFTLDKIILAIVISIGIFPAKNYSCLIFPSKIISINIAKIIFINIIPAKIISAKIRMTWWLLN